MSFNTIIEDIKVFFKKLLGIKPVEKTLEVTDEVEDKSLEEMVEEEFEKFKMNNIIFNKLNYLEQYIKIFSLPYPKEYQKYLNLIQVQRQNYESELKEYSKGLMGKLTLAMDPENESNRLVEVSNLETEIKDFVELVFNFSVYKEKFAQLCFKLNQFYNALLDTKKDTIIVIKQLNNATCSMQELVIQVKKFYFFSTDSRKKETILSYIIYAEYIFLKSALRCGLIGSFDDYKNNLSKFYNMFVDSEYKRLIFNFFIEDLEQYQMYITTNLKQDKISNFLLKTCQSLQTRLSNYENIFHDNSFFTELINFENTVDNISESNGSDYYIPLSGIISPPKTSQTTLAVNETAISVLDMLDSNKAQILKAVISTFKIDISWREFFFICKIFELYNDVIKVCSNSIFSHVANKFLRYDAKYSEYSSDFINAEKEKLLNYNGIKKKKYVLLLKAEAEDITTIEAELATLKLDCLFRTNEVYINQSYFKGFQNLEKNLGNYKLLEEIL